MNRLHILVLDDDEEDFILLNMVLEAESQYVLHWESDPDRAAERLLQESWDLAMVDYYLPRGRGTDFIAQLHEQGCSCPMLLRSGREDPRLLLEVQACGAAGFLSKNQMNATILSQVLQRALV